MMESMIKLLTILNLQVPIHHRVEWIDTPYPTSGVCGKTHVPTEIVIHHTATPNVDLKTTPERLRLLRKSHLARNFCDIGYHYLIASDGTVWEGVPINLRGSHVKGMNTGRIGISLIGNFEYVKPSKEQLATMENVIKSLKHKFRIKSVKGHRDYSNTICPSSNVMKELNRCQSLVK